ncbi:MAG: tRNA (adenosine(37)-N6)-dimethylallyltransferase MiaA [Bacteroidetes bacterium]|nr:tRNA (adenosine(37)-N6)-dimethylallyltransferase MiaA [Bacteroidota bacterium]
MLTILGPTASGKTRLAACIASCSDGEVISADSRQVYRGMNIGTGKDFEDYIVNDHQVPYHLIDIAEPGYEYNVFEFQYDFENVYRDIRRRNKYPVLCGGTGMYLEAVLKGYNLPVVTRNPEFESSMQHKTDAELIDLLKSFGPLHNTTDITDRNRIIRALEIAYAKGHPAKETEKYDAVVVGIHFESETLRKRITERLHKRLASGMIDEVDGLIKKGVPPDRLMVYGLEYKYITLYLTGGLNYNDMVGLLNTSIHHFAKRQRTWFRRMERNGITIHWIDGEMDTDTKIKLIKNLPGFSF